MTKFYYELEIAFNEKNYESIYNYLYISGITSILEDNGFIKISTGENDSVKLARIMDELVKDKIVNKNDISLSRLNNMDWNKEWEKTIEPVYIKNRIIVYPSWKKNVLKQPEGKILIEIDPKMSFGTGHNDTTQLILELMSDHLMTRDKFMLDFGCGTAILAIAAVKLGIKKAVAIDIDEDSIMNAREYTKLNGTAGQIDLRKADITNISETGFDVIAANITSNVIIPSLPRIHCKLKKHGKLFVSGILKTERDEMAAELDKHEFEIEDIKNKSEWTSFYAVKS
jgi:ribosomal protein L11 methyltransferase